MSEWLTGCLTGPIALVNSNGCPNPFTLPQRSSLSYAPFLVIDPLRGMLLFIMISLGFIEVVRWVTTTRYAYLAGRLFPTEPYRVVALDKA